MPFLKRSVMSLLVHRCDFGTGDRIDGRYTVVKILGEGSFGKVYKVRDDRGGIFALKLLKLWEVPSEIRIKLVERFDMEFETGRIDSRYLVRSLAHGMIEGNPYIVMEFCPGGDLKQLADKDRVDLARIGREVLYGLRDLHGCGKIHRDLKPENVLVKADGTAVLTDFGISGDRNKRMTERNILGKPAQIFGTWAYMPPEQVNPRRGDATVLPTTDIFSFGVMLYQLTTGELPFGRLDNENDLAKYIANGREERWDRACLDRSRDGRPFLPVIEGCLVADFRKRLQSVSEVLERMPLMAEPMDEPHLHGIAGMPANTGARIMLRIMQGEEHGKTYRLEEYIGDGRKIIAMGRQDVDDRNDLPLKEIQSAYVSRRHCTLEFDGVAGWYIRDGQWDRNADGGWCSSLNGTYVNSSEVSVSGMPIRIGDIISVGDIKLRAEGY